MTKLKQILEDRHISQYQLSRDVYICQSVINQIANGRVYPYPGYRRKICDYLQMPELEVFPEVLKKEEYVEVKSGTKKSVNKTP